MWAPRGKRFQHADDLVPLAYDDRSLLQPVNHAPDNSNIRDKKLELISKQSYFLGRTQREFDISRLEAEKFQVYQALLPSDDSRVLSKPYPPTGDKSQYNMINVRMESLLWL